MMHKTILCQCISQVEYLLIRNILIIILRFINTQIKQYNSTSILEHVTGNINTYSYYLANTLGVAIPEGKDFTEFERHLRYTLVQRYVQQWISWCESVIKQFMCFLFTTIAELRRDLCILICGAHITHSNNIALMCISCVPQFV